MSQYQIPATPRVISPSPTPSESQDGSEENYFGPVTRSSTRKRISTPSRIDEGIDDDNEEIDLNLDLRRPRAKSRSPLRTRKTSSLSETKLTAKAPFRKEAAAAENGNAPSGHLSPSSAASAGWSWRDLSRSPSPLGLIPIHRHWRSLVHRHEVPRKLLHVSIGFMGIWQYLRGTQPSDVSPYLLGALVPIVTADYLRFTFPSFNRVYVMVLGALMRETEYDHWNGVIWYLMGAWIVLTLFPKDIALVGVLLLSWCDTAASTVGRAYGRYTPRIRKGKSLAGSTAAFIVGVITAVGFWGYLGRRSDYSLLNRDSPFMFTGALRLPDVVRDALSLTEGQSSISGGTALAVWSLWTGFIASTSEVVNLFGFDDNLTIPVLSGIGMWAFLKVFG